MEEKGTAGHVVKLEPVLEVRGLGTAEVSVLLQSIPQVTYGPCTRSG
jgi:hypothetical protein